MRGLKDLPDYLIRDARKAYRDRQQQSPLVSLKWILRARVISLMERMEINRISLMDRMGIYRIRRIYRNKWKDFLFILIAFVISASLLIAFLLLG